MKLATKKLLGSAIFGLAVTSAVPSYAANDTLKGLIKIMHENGQINDAQYETLIEGAENDVKSSVSPEMEKTLKSLPIVTMKGKFKLESQDGQHAFQPIGRIFWDSVQSNEEGVSEVNEGTELRRVRLGFQAQFFKSWNAKLEYDFAGSDAELKDGWISYNNKFSNGSKYNVKLGQHHVPFGFNTISSSKYMSFLRRPLFADGPLSPARQVGVAFRVDADRYLVHAGAYQDEQDGGETHLGGDGKRTYSIRVAGTPWKQDKTHLFHAGVSLMHMDLNDNRLRVRQRAISHLDDRIFNTNNFAVADVKDVNAFDVELLGIYGSFHALGEYVNYSLDNAGTGADDLSAWSAEFGYFLTGESMKYKKGQFSGVSPKSPFMNGRGLGAWQVVARYENMDLNGGTTIGGDGDVVSLGVNWTPIKNVRFLGTWNKLVSFDKPGNINDGKKPSSLSLRALVYW